MVGIDRIMSEGRALTNAIGNSVATMVIAKWQGERDEEHFQRGAARPDDASTPRSSARCAARTTTSATGRFERDRETGRVAYAVTCSAAPSSAFSARSTDIATHVNVGVSRLV